MMAAWHGQHAQEEAVFLILVIMARLAAAQEVPGEGQVVEGVGGTAPVDPLGPKLQNVAVTAATHCQDPASNPVSGF
jgi:hypothetical protein